MSAEQWAAVDRYFSGLLAPRDEALEAALAESAAAGLPPHNVSPNQGAFLHLLARMQGASRALEGGTLGGYSTIWLARALPPGGSVVTLEANPAHAAVARKNVARAGLADVVELREGPAIETLAALAAEARGPFDLIFLDADKPGNPDYLAWALQLSRPGTAIVADNVVRGGAVLDESGADASVEGVRRMTAMLAAEPRVRCAAAVQTVGEKGHDGFLLALVDDAGAAER